MQIARNFGGYRMGLIAANLPCITTVAALNFLTGVASANFNLSMFAL
jgi:hypothetical protein